VEVSIFRYFMLQPLSSLSESIMHLLDDLIQSLSGVWDSCILMIAFLLPKNYKML